MYWLIENLFTIKYSIVKKILEEAKNWLEIIWEWKNPFDKKVREWRERVTLKVNSILWNPLYYSDKDTPEQLKFWSSAAWLWVFCALYEDRIVSSSWFSLRMFAIENDRLNSETHKNTLTPDWYLDIFNIEHFRFLVSYSVDEALKYWAIEEVTYSEAHRKIWIQEYIRDLDELWIADKTVYQVTPKWNWLIQPYRKLWDIDKLSKDQSQKIETGWVLQPV